MSVDIKANFDPIQIGQSESTMTSLSPLSLPSSSPSSNYLPSFDESVDQSFTEPSIFSNYNPYQLDPPPHNDELPSYSSGVSVEKSTSRSAPLLTLKLDNGAKNGYFYQTGGVVSGSVLVHPYNDLNIECVFIDLLLVESVKRSSDFPTRLFHRSSIAHYTPPLTAYPEDRTLLKNMAYTFQFSIQIPETRSSEGCKTGLHYRLPSSLGSLPDNAAYSLSFGPDVDVSDLSANVYYTVRARLMTSPTRVMSQHMNHIWIMPWSEDTRRESMASFNSSQSFTELSSLHSSNSSTLSTISDTSFESSKLITGGFLRKTALGKATIEVDNPRSIDILSRSSTILTSKIVFESNNSSVKPPLIKSINIKALLITITSASGKEINSSESVPLRTKVDPVQLQKLDISSKSSWELIAKNKFQTKIQLPINIPEGDLRFVPSFKSCLVERNYEFLITVNFESSSSIDIKVPIKLVCKRRRGNRGLYKLSSTGSKRRYSISSIDDEDEAPMYTLN